MTRVYLSTLSAARFCLYVFIMVIGNMRWHILNAANSPREHCEPLFDFCLNTRLSTEFKIEFFLPTVFSVSA